MSSWARRLARRFGGRSKIAPGCVFAHANDNAAISAIHAGSGRIVLAIAETGAASAMITLAPEHAVELAYSMQVCNKALINRPEFEG